MSCQNNLKQWGLAIHNYHDTYNKLPPTAFAGVNGCQGEVSWMVFVLPYIEQQNAYNFWTALPQGLSSRYGAYQVTAVPARQAQPKMLLCPSRRSPLSVTSTVEDRKPFTAAQYQIQDACTDYAACGGGDDSALDEGLIRPATSSTLTGATSTTTPGYYMWSSASSFATASDGLSNTVLIGEKHIRPADLTVNTAASNWSDWGAYNNGALMGQVRMMGQQTRVVNIAATGMSSWVTGVSAANPLNLPLAQGPTDSSTPFYYLQFGSWHPGVCQFVFGDGSVHAISNTTNILTLTWLARPDDGMVITGAF
jgi:hypothetical protein